MKTITRGNYNEIVWSSIPPRTRKIIQNLVNAASNAAKIDEHGSWDFGAEFDNKGRGISLNWDVYGYGKDIHTGRFLAVIQVRQFVRARKNYYPSIRKSYFLIGRNEDNSVFAHPVPARTVQYAARNGRNVILAVQNWIFGGDYRRMIRQGDLAIIPLSRPPRQAEKLPANEMVLEDSHKIQADEIRLNGNLYARNPSLTHIPGTHPHISATGWCKIIVGKRSRFWDFAAPTID